MSILLKIISIVNDFAKCTFHSLCHSFSLRLPVAWDIPWWVPSHSLLPLHILHPHRHPLRHSPLLVMPWSLYLWLRLGNSRERSACLLANCPTRLTTFLIRWVQFYWVYTVLTSATLCVDLRNLWYIPANVMVKFDPSLALRVLGSSSFAALEYHLESLAILRPCLGLGQCFSNCYCGTVLRDDFWLSSLRNLVIADERSDKVWESCHSETLRPTTNTNKIFDLTSPCFLSDIGRTVEQRITSKVKIQLPANNPP